MITRPSPTFVGRVEELELLEAARVRAADGEPAVVLVGGEAGVGKTRLIAELTARCGADGTRVLVGGCVPVGDGILPYAPIVEALRALPDELGVATVRELAGPSWRELARLLPALGEPDAGPPGQAAQARLFELLLGLLARLSEQTPIAVVVEDLHWSDQSTRDLLAFLVRNLHRNRVLVVMTYRNDEPGQERLGPFLAELDRGGPVQRLELPRLDQAQTTAQLVGILGAAPAAEVVDAVFARSEGNPYFTEELLAAVRAGSRELPATLRDLLRGRVQALPQPAQQVLGVVAVAGRPLPHRLLAKVAGLDDRHLDAALRAGVTHQLLLIRPREGSYDLRHALLREVIDTDLLPSERTRLHAAFARVLVELPELANTSPAVATAELAAHWDAGGEPTQALPARVRAGLAAEHAHAFAEATRHYQRALELWERVPDASQAAGLDLVDLLTRAAEAVAFSGAAQRAVELVEDALGRVDADAEPVRAAELLAGLGDHRRVAGDEVGALAAFERAERLVTGAPPSAEHARLLARHARALTMSFQNQKAIPYCEEAIAVARAVGAQAEEAHTLTTLGLCLQDLGELDRSIALHREARRIAEQVGDAETIVRTYVNLTYALTLAGRDREALDDARAGYQRPVNSAWNARRAATSPAILPSVSWILVAGRSASGSPGSCSLVTDGAPSICMKCGARCSLGGATSRPPGSMPIWRFGLAHRTSRTGLGCGWPSLPCGKAATTRRLRPLLRCSAGSRNEIPTGPCSSGPAPATRLLCGWRPIGPSGQPPDGRPRRSHRPTGRPHQSWPNWTGWPPRQGRRPATRSSCATCCSPRPSNPDSRDTPTRSDGRRQSTGGSGWSALSRRPTCATGRPGRCWPSAHLASRPRRCSARPTRPRSCSARPPCGARSSCSPNGAASAWKNQWTRLRRPRRRLLRRPRLA